MRSALRAFKGQRLLGFDTESRPAFRRGESNPPALVQLASSSLVVLIRLRPGAFPEALAGLLADPSVHKCGVGLADDLRKLRELHPFEPRGFLDLAKMAEQAGVKAAGLRTLAAALLGFRISKGAKTTNWERDPLSPAQVTYAATDAWVSREICLKLQAMGATGQGESPVREEG